METEQFEQNLQEQDTQDLKQFEDIMPETSIEFSKYITDPDAKKIFNEINKDLVVGNFNEKELIMIRQFFELAGHLFYLDMQEPAMQILRDAYTYATTSRSKLGFERRMLQSQFLKSTRTFESNQKKGWLR